jgi:hypothetical protein
MKSPDGGKREHSGAVQIMEDVRRMVMSLEAESNLSLLLDAKVVRDKYLGQPQRLKGDLNKPLRAASVRKYLHSYIVFLSFVIVDHVNITPDMDNMDVVNLKLKATNWRKAFLGDEKEEVGMESIRRNTSFKQNQNIFFEKNYNNDLIMTDCESVNPLNGDIQLSEHLGLNRGSRGAGFLKLTHFFREQVLLYNEPFL